MDTWLFIEVQTYQSVNKMGLELGKYVEKRYDQTVVHKDCIDDISADIKKKMEELQEKYPRCGLSSLKSVYMSGGTKKRSLTCPPSRQSLQRQLRLHSEDEVCQENESDNQSSHIKRQ